MNPDTHQFESLDTPEALGTARAKGWKIFKNGETVRLQDIPFTVVDISPNRLVLRPQGAEGLSSVPDIAALKERLSEAGAIQGIGWAVKQMYNGALVRRAGWNGKGMFVFFVPGSHFQVNRHPLLGIFPEGTEIDYRPHVDMKTADGQIVPWICTQSDLLATDWETAS